MKLSNALSLITDLRLSLKAALWPTLRTIFAQPSLFFRLRFTEISRVFMSHVWTAFGASVDEASKFEKDKLVRPYAQGVVLDIGAGHGHTVHYLDPTKVSHYIALEPNERMHQHIRAHAQSAGFNESDGTLLILSCGAEDTLAILSSLSSFLDPSQGRSQVDTILSVLTLCTVPRPQTTVKNLVRDVLKPGGQLLMYEHVLSERTDVAWWQRFWAPVWDKAFDGCRIDRPTDRWVKELEGEGAESESDGPTQSVWKEIHTWGKTGEDEECLFWHGIGRFVKK